jgi:hypothetical protein
MKEPRKVSRVSEGGKPATVPIGKRTVLETPPPGAGLKTVIEAVPGIVRSEAGMAARSCVSETNVVGRSEPFHRTIEPETK